MREELVRRAKEEEREEMKKELNRITSSVRLAANEMDENDVRKIISC